MVSITHNKFFGDVGRPSNRRRVLDKSTRNRLLRTASPVPTQSEKVSTLLPTKEQCITHLRLLRAFARLREDIHDANGLFGIFDTPKQDENDSNTLISEGAHKRWIVYVAKAADRFERWLIALLQINSFSEPWIRGKHCLQPGTLEAIMAQEHPNIWTLDKLPPLDVLMILHSYMLNPRDFLQDCLRYNMMALWRSGFPWTLLDQVLDPETCQYNPPSDYSTKYETMTSDPWDNAHSFEPKTIVCGHCSHEIKVDWTVPDSSSNTTAAYTEDDFSISCPSCSLLITHQTLQVDNFRHDLKLLLEKDIPMPGTILSIDGIPQSVSSESTTSPLGHEIFFPNQLLKTNLGTTILEKTNQANPNHTIHSINSIRDFIFDSLHDPTLLTHQDSPSTKTSPRRHHNPFSKHKHKAPKPTRTSILSLRRLVSSYQDNLSPTFSLDLAAAAGRQTKFTDKMEELDFLHSPSLQSTIQRSIVKFTVFFAIMARHKNHLAVPTFEVDLAWHTHQLHCTAYYEYSCAVTGGVFIDHDDKIGKKTLGDAFGWTAEQYSRIEGGVYDECVCWLCEAEREEDIRDEDEAGLEQRVIACQKRKFDDEFQRENDRRLKRGERLRSKQEYFETYLWKYPAYARPLEIEATV